MYTGHGKIESDRDELMNHVVIFAGGIGSRMGIGNCPKQFLKVDDKEIIIYTIEKFQHHPEIDAIYVACHKDWISYMKELVSRYSLDKVLSIVEGGESGQLSIYNGLCEAEKHKDRDDDIVLIHDGVRPVIDDELISANIESVRKFSNGISSAPAIETVILCDKGGEVKQLEDRSVSFYAKAPQSFFLKDILSCHRKALADGITGFIDSCTMMNHYGMKMHIVPCSNDNIKVTTPKDYYQLKALIRYKQDIVDKDI